MAIKRADIRKIFEGVDGVEESHIKQVMDILHSDIDPLRDELEETKEALSKEKENAGKDSGKYKKMYEEEHEAFEAYKKEQTEKETKAAKQNLVKDLLKDVLSEAGIKKVLKYHDFSGVEIGEDGNLKEAAKLKKELSEEWSDFVTKSGEDGADPGVKDKGGAGGTGSNFESMSLSEKMDYANSNPNSPEVQKWLGK